MKNNDKKQRKLTNTAFTASESLSGYGVFIANAIQLAKIVVSINISKALKLDVKETTTSSCTGQQKHL